MNTIFTHVLKSSLLNRTLLCSIVLLFQSLVLPAQNCTQVNAANNLIVNPSFENGTTGWYTTASLSTGSGYQICGPNGAFFYAYTNGSYNWVWQDIAPQPAGTILTFNGYFGVHASGLSCSPMVAVGFYDAANNLISYDSKNISTNVDISPYLPSLYSITSTVPAGTALIRVAMGANGDYIKIDALSLFASAPLPVKLVDFNCTLNDSKVQVNWTSAEDIGLSHYVVEKSADGINFKETGIVFPNNSNGSTYSYTDAAVDTRTNTLLYYRLRSVDLNGKSQLSDIRLIKTGLQESNTASITTYPNPVSSEIRITIPARWQSKKVLYEIVNNAGISMKKIVRTAAGQTEIIAAADLAPGFYFVKASCMQEYAQQKIIKE